MEISRIYRSRVLVVPAVAWLALVAGTLNLRAASVGSGAYQADFGAQPLAADWSTLSLAGGVTDFSGAAAMDAAVQGISASTVTSQVAADPAHPAPSLATATWSESGLYLQTRPAGNGASVLMCTLVNALGANAASATISYDFARLVPAAEELEGHRAYYSLSGEPGTWILIPELTAANPGRLTVTLNVDWISGGNLHLLWADDNGSPAEDAALQIDNFTAIITPAPQTAAVFTADPQSDLVTELRPARLTVGVSGNPPPSVQWYTNGVAVPGATGLTYSVASTPLAFDGISFRAVARNIANSTSHSVTSAVATLTVNPDLVRPVLLGAVAAGPVQVVASFSERVTALTATNLGNYGLTGPGGALAISNAFLDGSQTNVVLTVASMTPGAVYTLTVSGVRDQAVAANAVVVNSQAQLVAATYAAGDIGNPAGSGGAIAVGNGFDVTGGGTNVLGNSDQFAFNARPITGDFDLKVRLDDFAGTNPWAKAGLMAREALAADSRHATVFATPNFNGVHFSFRPGNGTNTQQAGAFPVAYPNTWLRLRRAGAVFTGFAGVDGQTWVQLGTATLTNPAAAFQVGLAVTAAAASGVPADTATAQFRDLGDGSGGVVAGVPLPFEPVGPSSRNTGLIISEIMYHPKAGNTLEFIELFNAGLIAEDLGGYRIAGAVDYVFPPRTLLPVGSFLVVARNPAALQAAAGISGVLGPWAGATTNALPDDAGNVRLRNRSGAIVLEVGYDSEAPWPAAADGTGHSLVLARPSYGEADPRAWAPSDRVGGSPGRSEPYGADPLRSVVINEFLAHTDLPLEDYIELYNQSGAPVDISGAYLSDDRDTNKFRIPDGTILPARGFVSFTFNGGASGFSLSSAGERIYLVNPSQTRVLDMVVFEAQANGVASGRFPDGAPGFQPLVGRTPGGTNAPAMVPDVVINELMFNPISGNDNDEYIELHNRSGAPVSVGDWRFTAGVSFRFPANTIIPANGYLVVAKDKARLLSRYPQLNEANTLGNFGGTLANGGERVALSRPDYFVVTNNSVVVTQANFVVVDETTYVDSGRAARWADGGGSSLELIDPFSNHRLPANWADSDETEKSVWTNLTVTAVADHVYPVDTAGAAMDEVQVMILGAGEVLMDDVDVHAGASGPTLVANPGFTSGTNGWTIQGNHVRSVLEPAGPNNPSPSLRIVASAGGDNGANRVECNLNGALAANTLATIGAKFRWLRGFPIVLIRVHGGGIEAVGTLPTPPNLGTPGLVNSRRVANAGPAIFDVVHGPVLPAAGQDVALTARVSDPDGVANVQVRYRIDPAATVNTVAMRDDGTAGDRVAGDGEYTAIVPGQAVGATIAFRVEATDARISGPGAATSLFPAPTAGEALIRFGEPAIFGGLGVYRIWMTASNLNLWTVRERLSNEALDGTFVYGNFRAIYNSGARYRGSPFTRNPTSPAGVGVAANYVWTLPDDEPLLGTDELNLDCLEPGGSSNVRDVTALREVTAFELLNQLGLPFSYQRYVHVVINGVTSASRNIPVYTDSQQPNGEYTAMWFPDGNEDGDLYKIDDWFEFNDTPARTGNKSASLENFTTTGGVKKQARYRWSWEKKANRGLDDDYSSLYGGVDALNAADAVYVRQVEENFDIREWLTALALRHVVGDWDGYGYQRGKNQFCYRPRGGKLAMLMWDLDFALGCNSGHAPNQDLFTVSLGGQTGSDNMPEVNRLYTHPHFRRMYLQALQQVAEGPLQDANFLPGLEARYQALLDNGVVGLTSPFVGSGAQSISIPAWMQQRRNFITSSNSNPNRISLFTNTPFQVTSPTTVTTGGDVLQITGTAPFGFREILINGLAWPVTWTSVTGFTARVVLNPGLNEIAIAGRTFGGEVIPAGPSVSATYTGQAPSPVGLIVFNEIMPYPTVEDAEFVEIVNTTAFSYDLSGWRVNGLDYTFPTGTILTNGQYLVLAKSISAVLRASGTNTPNVFAEFDGNLDRDGETLTLLKPGTGGAPDVVVDQLRYEARLPWVEAPIGTSLQLADLAEDNSRSSAWTAEPGGGPRPVPTPWLQVTRTGNIQAGTNLVFWLTTAGTCFLDDVSLVQTNPGSPNIVVNGDFENGSTAPWILGTNYAESVVVDGVSRPGSSGTRSLLVKGAAPASGTVLAATVQQFVALHPSYLANTNYTLSYWISIATNPITMGMRTLLGSQLSTSGSTFVPVAPPTPVVASPGVANSVVATNLPPYDPVWVNELQASNVSGPVDNVGERDPWIELYNRGSNPVSLNGYYLAANYDTNLTEWPFPASAIINPGQFLVIWADGQPGQTSGTQFHTSFRLNSVTGSVALVRIANGLPQITDYLTYANLGPGLSYGDFPDGQPFQRMTMQATSPGGTNVSRGVNLFINEWMAGNTNFIVDPADGGYSDWFEIYNAGDAAVDLGGYYLTDSLNNRTQFQVPTAGRYVVPPGGFLLVWADEDSGTQNTDDSPDLHVNFRLGGGGDSIGLFAPDGNTVIDSVTFGRQTNDVSQGRFADGSANIVFMTSPTPRAANQLGGRNTPPSLQPIPNRTILFGQTVSFTAVGSDSDLPAQTLTYTLGAGAPAGASIAAGTGAFTWTPSQAQVPSTNQISVRVTDSGIPPITVSRTFTVVVQTPSVAFTLNGSNLQIAFGSVSGKNYRIEFKNSLSDVTWTPLPGSENIVGNGGTISVNTLVTANPQRFFRIVQLN